MILLLVYVVHMMPLQSIYYCLVVIHIKYICIILKIEFQVGDPLAGALCGPLHSTQAVNTYQYINISICYLQTKHKRNKTSLRFSIKQFKLLFKLVKLFSKKNFIFELFHFFKGGKVLQGGKRLSPTNLNVK